MGFSLLGHLDFDLDLELDEMPGFATESMDAVDDIPPPAQTAVALAGPALRGAPIVLDRSQPLFFAPPMSWRESGFYRTQAEDEIRKEWETKRGELTKGWKKRAKEAQKARKRGGGGVD